MPVFEYKGLGSDGKDVHGILDAENPKVARVKLRQSGIFPTELSETQARSERGEGLSIFRFYRKAKRQEVAVFTRQMATLLAAGLTLMESLSTALDQIEDPVLQKVITQVREKVKEGRSLSDALRGYPQVFSDRFGFLPDLSALDLLCCMGPQSAGVLARSRPWPPVQP